MFGYDISYRPSWVSLGQSILMGQEWQHGTVWCEITVQHGIILALKYDWELGKRIQEPNYFVL